MEEQPGPPALHHPHRRLLQWQDQGKGRRKQPFYITSRDGQPLALAGLWATWRDPAAARDDDGDGGGDELWTCTILTTSANQLMGSVHERMPVILPPDAWDAWLDPANTDAAQLATLLQPAPEELLAVWPVDPAVGNVRNNRPELAGRWKATSRSLPDLRGGSTAATATGTPRRPAA